MTALERPNQDESVQTVMRILKSAEMNGLDLAARKVLLNIKRQHDGWSPLALAAVQGKARVVAELLKLGTDPLQKVSVMATSPTPPRDGRSSPANRNLDVSPYLLTVQSVDLATYAAILSDSRFKRTNLVLEVQAAIRLAQPRIAEKLRGIPLENIQKFHADSVSRRTAPNVSVPTASCEAGAGSGSRVISSGIMETPYALLEEHCIVQDAGVLVGFSWLKMVFLNWSGITSYDFCCRGNQQLLLHRWSPHDHQIQCLQYQSHLLLASCSHRKLRLELQFKNLQRSPIGFLLGGHRVYRLGNEPNAVWTEPLKDPLTQAILEFDYTELMDRNQGCFALNPPAERQRILDRVKGDPANGVPQQAPDRGCYPPLYEDLVRMQTARGYPQFQPPTFLLARWFRSASLNPNNANNARNFNGGNGNIDNDHHDNRKAVFCRCVGAAWRKHRRVTSA